jgi:hypothetical protein
MTYTQRMKQQYGALITTSKAWHEAYRLARDHGWDRKAALELANLSVTMG